MIRRNKPEGSHKTATNLKTVFSNENNTRYLIKSDLQRRYCWTKIIVEHFFKDYLIDLYDANVEADSNGEDNWYGTVDDAIFVKKDENGIQEIVDSGQRMTTSLAIVCVFLFLILKDSEVKNIEERKKLFESYIKTKNKLYLKLSNTFEDSDVIPTIESLTDGTFQTTKKAISEKKRVFERGKKGEIVYKQFSSLCALIYTITEETIGLNDKSLLDRLNCFLENTYFDVEECEKSERVARFQQANTNRIEIPNADIYKTLMCAKGEAIDKKFQEFEKCINDITGKNKKIHIIKSPLSPIEYIMRLGIILKDNTKKSCSFYYSLDNEDNGIVWHLENEDGLLYTEEKVLDYLDGCIDICNFLKTSTDYVGNTSSHEDYYMLTEGRNSPYIWLYNILPSYIISKICDNKKKEFAFNLVLISYMVYSIKCVSSKSVQYIQPYMYEISKIMLERKDDNFGFEDFKNGLVNEYTRVFGEFIKNHLTANVKRLSYGDSIAQSAIFGIMSVDEYYTQKGANIKKDNLHKLLTTKRSKKNVEQSVQLDHIYPQSNKNEENETEIDSIGNLALLEGALNASKGNNQGKTFEAYSNSSFLTTKVMIEDNRYEFLTQDTLDNVRKKYIPYTTSSDGINNFGTDEIIERRNRIADKIRMIASLKLFEEEEAKQREIDYAIAVG